MNSNPKATQDLSKLMKDVFDNFSTSISDETYTSLAEVVYSICSIHILNEQENEEPKEPRLISPLPCFWNKGNLIEAHDRFQKCMSRQVDCEGFINGFAWALTIMQGE